jgi:hypothetical protein
LAYCDFAFCFFVANDPPSFTPGAAVTVTEDSLVYGAAWATNISAGPGEDDELAFTVNCSSAPPGFFAAAPSIAVASGRLTFTPAADAFGSVSCTVTLAEVMPGGLSVSEPLTIAVTPGELSHNGCSVMCIDNISTEVNSMRDDTCVIVVTPG